MIQYSEICVIDTMIYNKLPPLFAPVYSTLLHCNQRRREHLASHVLPALQLGWVWNSSSRLPPPRYSSYSRFSQCYDMLLDLVSAMMTCCISFNSLLLSTPTKVCVVVFLHTNIYLWILEHKHPHTNTHTHTHRHVCMHACMHACCYACMCVLMHARR